MFKDTHTLHEKCPNAEFNLVQQKLRIWTLFTQWQGNKFFKENSDIRKKYKYLSFQSSCTKRSISWSMELCCNKECQLSLFYCNYAKICNYIFGIGSSKNCSSKNFNRKTLHEYFFFYKLYLIATVISKESLKWDTFYEKYFEKINM